MDNSSWESWKIQRQKVESIRALLHHLPILFPNFPRRLNHPDLLLVASLDRLFFHFFLLVPPLLGELCVPVHIQKQSISDGIIGWRSQLEKTFDGSRNLTGTMY